jgi:hypothetical protein
MIIVLPGRGYTAQGPAISIPVLALRESGGSEEVSNVSYLPWQADNTTPYVDLQEMHVLRQIDAALKADTSGPVVFVAKSIGTEILTRVVRQVDLVNRAVSVIWITPLFGRPGRADAAIGLGFASLLVAGSEMPSTRCQNIAGFAMLCTQTNLSSKARITALRSPTMLWPRPQASCSLVQQRLPSLAPHVELIFRPTTCGKNQELWNFEFLLNRSRVPRTTHS